MKMKKYTVLVTGGATVRAREKEDGKVCSRDEHTETEYYHK